MLPGVRLSSTGLLTTLSINKKNKLDKLSDKAQNNIQISSINSLNFTSPDYLDEMPSKPITIEDKTSESIKMTVVDENKENAKGEKSGDTNPF